MSQLLHQPLDAMAGLLDDRVDVVRRARLPLKRAGEAAAKKVRDARPIEGRSHEQRDLYRIFHGLYTASTGTATSRLAIALP